MNFKKFNSIENVQHQRYLDKVVEEGKANQEFVVTEKVHGANFSMHYNGIDFKIASRSGFIGLEGNFYGVNNHIDSLKERILKLYDLLGNGGEVSVYGEWFGGFFPDNVSPAGTKRVQKEVCYCPHNDFYGFDIVKDDVHLNVDDRNDIFAKSGYHYARVLKRGTLQECLDYPNDFLTTIPHYYGLPDIEGNIAEGTVIEPVEYCTFLTGSRIIFKNKNEKFKEGKERKPQVKEDIKLSDKALEKLNWLLGCVNKNRRNAVVSKFDFIDEKKFGPLMGSYIVDIIDEYRSEFEEEIEQDIDEKEAKKIKKELSKAVQLNIREDFINIIDNFKD